MVLRKLTANTVSELLPNRKPDTHKGDYGKILLLCGSRGFTGAAVLSALGALRSGAGLVYLGVPESIYAIEAIKLTEPIVFPLPDENGMISCVAAEQVRKMLPQMDAVLIGPGLGQSNGTDCLLQTVLNNFSGPVVIDADGINLISKHIHMLRERTGITILTPHAKEFERIGGDLSKDRVDAALEFALRWKCILLLKGHHTVVTDGVHTYINPTGNPGMAVGGSGDVLAGIIASLLGQGIEPLEAAACGAYLHGQAGDICAQEIGQYGMLPSDMLNVLPRLMK